MNSSHSVTQWIKQLQLGDLNVAKQLWDRYAAQLVELARRKLGTAPKRLADEEDIAQSVFHSVCRGAAAGRFNDIKSRDDLWWLLLAITKQKVVDHIRRETAKKRGGGRVMSESGLSSAADDPGSFTLDNLIGEAPSPDFIAMLEEQSRHLLGLLRDDGLRIVALSRIEGYSVSQIACELALSHRTIERKLQLIRKAWAQELTCGN